MSRKPPMSSTPPWASRRARGSTRFARNGRKRAPERNPPILGSSIQPFRVGCPLTITSGSPSPCALPSSIRRRRWRFITATGSHAKSTPRKQRQGFRRVSRQSCSKSSRCRRRHRQPRAQIGCAHRAGSYGGRDCHAFAEHILRRLRDSRGRQPRPNRGDPMTARAFTTDVLAGRPGSSHDPARRPEPGLVRMSDANLPWHAGEKFPAQR
jgi:hypothetical protein